MVLHHDEPFTVANLPQLIACMRGIVYKSEKANCSETRDNLILTFEAIYDAAFAHDMSIAHKIWNCSMGSGQFKSLMSSFNSAPASLHLAYGYPDYPELYIPFTEWYNAPVMRAKLNLLPEIPKTLDTPDTPETPETATVAKVLRTRNTRKALSTPETPAPSNKGKSVD
ncbi:hypothetical protein GGI17_002640 [Coemansia sp. S146]|nr:hypothetical protein GGI17_002640 [Coemansia sp. S146]